MITGDNPLTACHVAKELKITSKKLLILTPPPLSPGEEENTDNVPWHWENISGSLSLPLQLTLSDLRETYDLCLTGDVSYKYFVTGFTGFTGCGC